jgi:5-methylcytosine-specific restriction endonuclease McrA
MSSNPELMREYMKRRYHRRRTQALALLGGRCRCGATSGLEIDHINPSEKEYSIAKILAGGAEAIVRAELAKCQLLCRACHEEKTLTDLGFTKGQARHLWHVQQSQVPVR